MPPEILPEVFFAVDQSLTDESIETTTIIVKLSLKTSDVVTVGYAVAGGTAKVGSGAGSDVSTSEGEVTFQPFQDTAQLTVTVVDDGVEEEEEDVRITLRSAENAELGDRIDHRLRISANKLPRVRFVNATSSADERDGAQSFAVQLDTLSPEDVVVRYTWGGTSEQADHGVTDGLLTIRANQISQPLPVPITNDPTDEEDETLELSLIAQSGAVVAPGLGLHGHTIVDDDPPPAIGFAATASATGEGAGAASLEVRLGLPSEKPISVAYAVTAGSAGGDDATLATGTLTFPPGTAAQTVDVTIANDALDEDDETIRVTLSNASNATLQGQANLPSAHTLTITDDDNAPTIEFQQASSTVAEAAGTHAVAVRLSAPSGRPVQFSVTRAGTAAPEDLTLPATTFTIPPGATTATINATVANDAADDDNETVALTLGGLVNAGAGPQGTHTITIQDDDDAPQVRFDPATPDRAENERDVTTGTYTYRVVLSAASAKPVTVNVTVGGTTQGNDFTIASGDIPVVFQPGQTQRDIRLSISPDNSNEDDETVTLTLGSVTNATNAADNQVRTHTIVDDD